MSELFPARCVSCGHRQLVDYFGTARCEECGRSEWTNRAWHRT